MTVYVCMQGAMRRCGHNPTDIEVSDIINKIHNDTGSLDFEVGAESPTGDAYSLYYIKKETGKLSHALREFFYNIQKAKLFGLISCL